MAFSIAAQISLSLLRTPPTRLLSAPAPMTNRFLITPLAAFPEKISLSSFSGSKTRAKPSLDLCDELFPTARPKKKAFIWVADRRDLLSVAKRLAQLGYDIFSSDYTARILRMHKIPVAGVIDLIQLFSSKLAKICKKAGLDLGEGDLQEEDGQEPFDIIVMNFFVDDEGQQRFFPSKETFAPFFYFLSMKRKNILAVVDPEDYTKALLMLQCIEAYGENAETMTIRTELKMKEEKHIARFRELAPP